MSSSATYLAQGLCGSLSLDCKSAAYRKASRVEVSLSQRGIIKCGALQNEVSVETDQGKSGNGGRRGLLTFSISAAMCTLSASVLDASCEAAEEPAVNPLVAKLLEQSRANKEKNDRQRLDDYTKRNYGDYFKFMEGSIRREGASENDKKILEWLERNK
eukprot:TRINITY_DN3570_c0_g1_i1.p1 TRINITY_DN3570_c0_g1~~TRINITY_DN3570_c0_g1_i1.p1  ORF type:complete len:159 (+),score=14.57 TRINITY_DN3570_c0_g1_i1:48-524(+)